MLVVVLKVVASFVRTTTTNTIDRECLARNAINSKGRENRYHTFSRFTYIYYNDNCRGWIWRAVCPCRPYIYYLCQGLSRARKMVFAIYYVWGLFSLSAFFSTALFCRTIDNAVLIMHKATTPPPKGSKSQAELNKQTALWAIPTDPWG